MKIMAVDLGDARTGLAVCDSTEFLASPVGVINEKDNMKILTSVAAASKEYAVKQIVVGLPLNMDGTKGERAEKAELFAKRLEKISGIPVVMWDERQTTLEANIILNDTDTRGKKRKKVIDAVAATIILESYLSYRKNTYKG